MKFKIQSHTIDISSNTNPIADFSIVFSFDRDLLTNAKNFFANVKPCDIDSLTDAGSSSLVGGKTLIVSLGDKDKFTVAVFQKVLKNIASFIASGKKIVELNLVIEDEVAKLLSIDLNACIEQTLFHILNNLYYFDNFKSKKQIFDLTNIYVISKNDANQALDAANCLLDGVILVKNLANLPANHATPSYLADVATEFANISKNVKVDIFDKKDIEKLQMNTFLAVAKGSTEQPKFIQMQYNGANSDVKPIVLVGKGITFDSGGISIKPSSNMNEMKFDMCGAATVMGVFASVANLGLPINLIAVVPACENMPSGNALKPGDIITSMSGQTIEILNTDAEGRLILCDALTYVKRFDPEVVIDVATLTGACVVALGSVASGLYVNDDNFASDLMDSATVVNDKVWRMPLYDEYAEGLKSPVADLMNIAGWGGKGGSVTAAMFLSKFVDYKWAHLDIAGTAWGGAFAGGEHGASGRPFYLLMDYIRKSSK